LGAPSAIAAPRDPKRRKIVEALADLPEPIIDAILNLITLAPPKA
jgi:hypothetical protein